MKTNLLFLLLICLVSTSALPQDNRIDIEGTIYVDRNDKEGVTVFNSSSGKGTVTDKDGKFTIAVAVNDRIEFSALQFEDFVVVVTQQMIDANKISVFLIEQVNKLDEVLILPHDLTGNLSFDASNIELMNPNLDALYFGLGNLDKFEFTADHLSEIENIAVNENRIVNGIDVINVFGQLLIPIFKSKDNKNKTDVHKRKRILDVYPKEQLTKMLNLNEKDLMEFIYYIEDNNNFDDALLNADRELEFIAYMKKQQQEFSKMKDGKN